MPTSKLNKFRQLSPAERRLLVQSLLWLPVIHPGLLLLGYSRLRGVLERLAPLKSIDPPLREAESARHAQAIARIVSIAAVHGLYRATCLRRSLLVWWFLRRAGLEGQICFGVRLSKDSFEAHAWVEYNRIVINDSAKVHEQYLVLQDVPLPTQSGL